MTNGGRKFTCDSAIEAAARGGVRKTVEDERTILVIPEGVYVGNGTLGALDYLYNKHKIRSFRILRSGGKECINE